MCVKYSEYGTLVRYILIVPHLNLFCKYLILEVKISTRKKSNDHDSFNNTGYLESVF